MGSLIYRYDFMREIDRYREIHSVHSEVDGFMREIDRYRENHSGVDQYRKQFAVGSIICMREIDQYRKNHSGVDQYRKIHSGVGYLYA